MLSQKTMFTNAVPHEKALITVNDLSHTFGSGDLRLKVLHQVNVDFYPGEIAIIMGPSGSGKTTLLTLAGALRSIQEGSIVLDGIELKNATKDRQLDARHKIGFIFQAHNLLEALNARENVQMGLVHRQDLSIAEMQSRSMAMLGRVGLAGHEHKHPRQLSGGQRQRVAVARALVREPSIIMADEPTAALDKNSGRELVELLQRLAREMRVAILMVTHDNRILDVADRILTLEDGRMEESHRGLERAAENLQEVFNRIARYPSFFAPDKSDVISEDYDVFTAETGRRLAAVDADTHMLVARRLCANLAREAETLADISETISMLEEGVRQFGDIMGKRPSGLAGERMNSLFESLEFLLITAAETLASRKAEDIAILKSLTEDKGPLLEKLRARHFQRNAADSRLIQDYEFDINSIFVRLIYFIHHLAFGLEGMKPVLN
jgi:putative ABC transport system ATP-binding protein